MNKFAGSPAQFKNEKGTSPEKLLDRGQVKGRVAEPNRRRNNPEGRPTADEDNQKDGQDRPPEFGAMRFLESDHGVNKRGC